MRPPARQGPDQTGPGGPATARRTAGRRRLQMMLRGGAGARSCRAEPPPSRAAVAERTAALSTLLSTAFSPARPAPRSPAAAPPPPPPPPPPSPSASPQRRDGQQPARAAQPRHLQLLGARVQARGGGERRAHLLPRLAQRHAAAPAERGRERPEGLRAQLQGRARHAAARASQGGAGADPAQATERRGDGGRRAAQPVQLHGARGAELRQHDQDARRVDDAARVRQRARLNDAVGALRRLRHRVRPHDLRELARSAGGRAARARD